MGSTGSTAPQDGDFVADARPRVEAALLAAVSIEDPFLTEVASHLIKAGGKRVRPLFAVAAGACGGSGGSSVPDSVVQGGVAVELVHLGSLYHDDVIDEAVTRRTVESVNARWGNLTAILAGDFLLAKASEIAASLGVEVAGLLAATIGRLCQGEVGELRAAYDISRSEDAYLQSIRGKTASLFATACRIGALVAELDRPSVDALTRFGDGYGMAFQIVDDVLDLTATAEQLGKPVGHDLVEGVYTLPVLRALADDSELKSMLGSPLDDDQLTMALTRVRANGAVGSAIEDAQRFVDGAVAALDPLGDRPGARWLAAAAGSLTQPFR
jgi:heptaprenyl diphosphate synthase